MNFDCPSNDPYRKKKHSAFLRVCRWNHFSLSIPCDNLLQYLLRFSVVDNFFVAFYASIEIFVCVPNEYIVMICLFFFYFSFSYASTRTRSSANVNGKDISLYTAAKDKLATSSSMKKPDFKAAIDQIESALRGEDPAPNSYEVSSHHTSSVCLRFSLSWF